MDEEVLRRRMALAQTMGEQMRPEPFQYQEPQSQVAMPQQAAAGFYNLPPVDDLAGPPPGVAEPTASFARPFDSLFPGYRESANVEDRRGRFDDMKYADELDDAWRSSAAAPLMGRR